MKLCPDMRCLHTPPAPSQLSLLLDELLLKLPALSRLACWIAVLLSTLTRLLHAFFTARLLSEPPFGRSRRDIFFSSALPASSSHTSRHAGCAGLGPAGILGLAVASGRLQPASSSAGHRVPLAARIALLACCPGVPRAHTQPYFRSALLDLCPAKQLQSMCPRWPATVRSAPTDLHALHACAPVI